MGWPKRSSGGVRQWVLTMANALVESGYVVDVLSEALRRRFVDEPLLDARVGRVILGHRLLARFRLDAYVRAHPGVRAIAAGLMKPQYLVLIDASGYYSFVSRPLWSRRQDTQS